MHSHMLYCIKTIIFLLRPAHLLHPNQQPFLACSSKEQGWQSCYPSRLSVPLVSFEHFKLFQSHLIKQAAWYSISKLGEKLADRQGHIQKTSIPKERLPWQRVTRWPAITNGCACTLSSQLMLPLLPQPATAGVGKDDVRRCYTIGVLLDRGRNKRN